MFDKPTVVAVHGTPHGPIGNSAVMIEMLHPTLQAEGFDLVSIDLTQLNIKYCVGCAFCLEHPRCWQEDDHAKVMDQLLAADGVVFASPVYFNAVTAQMKTFIDRSLAFGHKPRPETKPGLALSVSAGMGEVDVAEYLGGVMRIAGAFCVGRFTAIAAGPGSFVGLDLVKQRAQELAQRLARAIQEKRRYPATERDLRFWLFIGSLIRRNRHLMEDDYKHWEKHGFLESFENYMKQETAQGNFDPEQRKQWLKQMMKAQKQSTPQGSPDAAPHAAPASEQRGPEGITSCRELIEQMPRAFDPAQAGELSAVIQFEISGDEEFTAHLVIADGACEFVEGPAPSPSLTIASPASVWLEIAQGKLDGQAAFMSGKYTTQGDISILMRLSKLFGRRV